MTDRPRWRIDDVLARTDLAGLLDEVAVPGAPTTRGRRWHCPVPSHEDRRPSVTVKVDHRGHERWHCWSGDDTHRGDAIDLVMVTQRLNKTEALDWLANRAGMTPDRPLPPPRRKPAPQPRIVPLSDRVVRYVDSCERMLWTTQPGRQVLGWLHGRGFSDDVLRANRVGADPGAELWMPQRRGLPHGDSLAATFPALGRDGDVRYVQARYLQRPVHGDKYDNPAGSLGSNPRLAWARTPHLRRDDVMVICEGIPDALTAADAGYRAVGVLGAQAPDLDVAMRLVTAAGRRSVVAVVDADAAGRGWGNRLVEHAKTAGATIDVVVPPDEGVDLNAWAQRDPQWDRALALPVVGFAAAAVQIDTVAVGSVARDL